MFEDQEAVNMKQCCNDTDRVNVKVKVKVSLEQATKIQMGSRGITLLFL